MYQGVLLEYSAILVNRISNLPMDIQKQAFLYARDVLEKNYQMKFDEELPSKWRCRNSVILGKSL